MKITSNIKYKAEINITSLIDLLFLLLIFFMVTSSLNSESSIVINLPRSSATAEKIPAKLIVTVSGANEVYLNDIRVALNELPAALRKYKTAKGTDSVVIRGDKKADYQTIIDVMDKLNQSGLPKFTLSTVK